jgi:hypothetical protein
MKQRRFVSERGKGKYTDGLMINWKLLGEVLVIRETKFVCFVFLLKRNLDQSLLAGGTKLKRFLDVAKTCSRYSLSTNKASFQ